MYEIIKIEDVTKTCDSPFIITLNDKFQFIGDEARAMEHHCRKGMTAKLKYHMCNESFIVERMYIPEMTDIGSNLNIYI